MIDAPSIVAVILAGGQARRMGGGDKCLKTIAGRPLLDLVIERARPQASRLVINANGDPARFAGFGLPVVADSIAGFAGPLAGVLAGLDWTRANAPSATHVASIASDTPFFPTDLVARLAQAAAGAGVPLACAASGGRAHPVFGLWPVALADDLRAALESGVRRVDEWTARHGIAEAAFEAPGADPFFNINTPDDLATAERRLAERGMTTPVIGVAGLKNAGKTTLVTRLVAELVGRGYRVSTVKHGHHSAEIDRPGTDSYGHRAAGASEVALVTPARYAVMGELRGAPEPGLDEILRRLAPADLVIVEGFKRAPIPKIEVRRGGSGGAPPSLDLPGVVAIASDAPVAGAAVPVLALDDVATIADFVVGHLGLRHPDVRAAG